MAPFWTAPQREQSLQAGLLEALYNLSEQASPEGRWRIQALIEDLRERAPGRWVVDELRGMRPWLTPRPVETGLDSADAVQALLQALKACQRQDPDLAAAVAVLERSVPERLDPASARRVARGARELQRFALRASEKRPLNQSSAQQVIQHSLETLERSQARLTRSGDLDEGERVLILRDLEELRAQLTQLREDPVETLSADEDNVIAMVG